MPRRAYHHGNLRRALLDAALRLFAERGSFDFTFRELGRAAGVTHNAPYRHFAGRAELLAALREEALSALGEASRVAIEGVSEPRARVAALGEAYVRFALAQPERFRLVLAFAPEEGEPRRGESFRLLESALEDGQREGTVRADRSPRELAIGAWALVHGAASLLASGNLAAARLKQLVPLLTAVFFDGVGVEPPRKARSARRR